MDVASEPRDQLEEGAAAGFRAAAEAQYGLARLVTLSVPYGQEWVDTTLLRFLRARGGDEAAALVMIGQALELRAQEKLDTILDRPLPTVVIQHLHASYDEGWLPRPDRVGRPVYLLRGGRTGERLERLFSAPATGMDWALSDVTEAFIHNHLQMMEYLNKVIFRQHTEAAKGRTINKFVLVNDLSGMGTQGVAQIMKFADIMKRMAAVDQLLYPEGLGVPPPLNTYQSKTRCCNIFR